MGGGKGTPLHRKVRRSNMTIKGDVNKKWTSTDAYRDNHDRIFGGGSISILSELRDIAANGCDERKCTECPARDLCVGTCADIIQVIDRLMIEQMMTNK